VIKNSNKIVVAMFIAFLLSVNIASGFTTDKSFSEFENRMLSQFPRFTVQNFMSGRYTDKFEEYVTDQFPLRDTWVAIKSDLERLTFKTINNGIFFGEDGYLLEDYKKPGGQLNDNINSINRFASKLPGVLTHFLMVPNSVKIYEDKLPPFASPYDQLVTFEEVSEGLSEDVDFIGVYDTLLGKKDEYIYYRTDHHWTMRGAFYAYETLADHLGIIPYEMDDFDSEIISDSFYGTFYSKANNAHISPDSIEIFKPKFEVHCEVNFLDSGKTSDSLYEYSYLSEKDKYSMFLDGNHSLIKINTDIKNGKKLVVFKDSYSHCFIPFLANHYEEVHVIDLRYYKLNVYEYIKENHINEALFLYNVTTFSDNENIEQLKL
jgi:hypothetical protein